MVPGTVEMTGSGDRSGVGSGDGSGVRSGVDVIRMLALGAKGVLLGRSYIYALATAGEAGVAHLLRLYAEDMKVTMTLTGAASPADIRADCLDRLEKEMAQLARTHVRE